MSRRHRPSRADRKPVTRRYVARLIQRQTQELLSAMVTSERLARLDGDGDDVGSLLPRELNEAAWRALFPRDATSRTD